MTPISPPPVIIGSRVEFWENPDEGDDASADLAGRSIVAIVAGDLGQGEAMLTVPHLRRGHHDGFVLVASEYSPEPIKGCWRPISKA